MKTPQVPPLAGMTPLGITPTLYVRQDGADFYIYETTDDDAEQFALYRSAIRVRDFDLPAAQLAREEFLFEAKRLFPSTKLVLLEK